MPMIVPSTHTDRWHGTIGGSAQAIWSWWNAMTGSWSNRWRAAPTASSLAILLIAGLVSGCAGGTGMKEETLYAKIVSNYDLETEAAHKFYNNSDKGAIEI